MSLLVATAALATASALWFRMERERRLHGAALAALEERVRELTLRVDVTVHDVIEAGAQAEVAEHILLDKGVADADDLEATRRRLDGEHAGGSARDGDLH